MPNKIEALIADCRNQLNTVKDAVGVTQTLLSTLTTRLDTLEKEVVPKLTTATEAEKSAWESELNQLLQAIQQVANDGPTDKHSEMYKDFASNARIYMIAVGAILFTAASILLLVVWARRPEANAWPCGLPPEVACALPLVAIMGALGGLLTCIQSFGRYVGNRQLYKSWTLYYCLFPLKGAGLAIIVFFLIHTDLGKRELDTGASAKAAPAETNVVTMAGAVSTNITTGPGGQSITNIATNAPVGRIDLVTKVVPSSESKKPNLVLACLIAALTGLFANQAIEMLASVFSVVFKKVEGKDPVRDNPGSNAPPSRS